MAEELRLLCLFIVLLSAFLTGCRQEPESSGRSASERTLSEKTDDPRNDDARKRQLSSLLEFDADESVVQQQVVPQFRNVAAEQKIDFLRFSDAVPERYFLPEVMGGGVAWVDVDHDGIMDLYAVNGDVVWQDQDSSSDHINRLYRNTGSGFDDVTLVSDTPDARFGQGCTVGDFNSDGFQDLYITNYGRNTLLASNGDGTFSDITIFAGVGCEAWSSSAVWLDADRDGFADLYTVNYLDVTRTNHKSCEYVGVRGYCGPGEWAGVSDVLYLNSGDGRFVAADSVADDIDPANTKGLAVAVADFDQDQVAEIYVANDMVPNFLLQRIPDPVSEESPLYQNVAVSAGCAVSNEGRNEASMGIACSDFDGDGMVDVFLTHFFESKNTLYRNLGSLLFEDASRQSRIAATSFDKLGFGTVAFDANLDGFDDIFIANGHVLGPKMKPNQMTPQLLVNDGTGIFGDVSERVGGYFKIPCLGRGVAGGDFDNDGRPDLAVSHLDLPLALLHNETPREHHFIGLELLSQNRCYPAGGRLIVTSSQGRRVIPVVTGGSYLSTNDPRLLIGLGDDSGPVDVEMLWPDQHSTRYQNLLPDRYWILPESGAAVLGHHHPESN